MCTRNKVSFFSLVMMLVACALVESAAAQTQDAKISGNNNSIVQVIIELSGGGDPAVLRQNQDRITKLAVQLGVSNALIFNFLDKIGDSSAPDSWPTTLAQIADHYREFQRQAQLLSATNPELRTLISDASIAASQARFDEADRLLNQAQEQEKSAEEKLVQAARSHRINRVAILVEQAQNKMVQQHYAEAGDFFAAASALEVDIDLQKSGDLREDAQNAGFLEWKCGAVGTPGCPIDFRASPD
jgi:hypothetical protein